MSRELHLECIMIVALSKIAGINLKFLMIKACSCPANSDCCSCEHAVKTDSKVTSSRISFVVVFCRWSISKSGTEAATISLIFPQRSLVVVHMRLLVLHRRRIKEYKVLFQLPLFGCLEEG